MGDSDLKWAQLLDPSEEAPAGRRDSNLGAPSWVGICHLALGSWWGDPVGPHGRRHLWGREFPPNMEALPHCV